ncbi:MAG: hypothetical protein C0167_01520 [Nitrososphaera sp.]|nr:MAG: hypothetical protein C0167_01520 [Nitrososphaera sp.]
MSSWIPLSNAWFCPLSPPKCPYHFYVSVSLGKRTGYDGLFATLTFGNNAVPNCSKNVEVWHPISGHLDLWLSEGKLLPLGEILDISGYPAGTYRDMLLRPGSTSDVLWFYIPLGIDARRNLALSGAGAQLVLHLSFSVLYDAGVVSQKTYSCHPVLRFSVPAQTLRELIGDRGDAPQL